MMEEERAGEDKLDTTTPAVIREGIHHGILAKGIIYLHQILELIINLIKQCLPEIKDMRRDKNIS